MKDEDIQTYFNMKAQEICDVLEHQTIVLGTSIENKDSTIVKASGDLSSLLGISVHIFKQVITSIPESADDIEEMFIKAIKSEKKNVVDKNKKLGGEI